MQHGVYSTAYTVRRIQYGVYSTAYTVQRIQYTYGTRRGSALHRPLSSGSVRGCWRPASRKSVGRSPAPGHLPAVSQQRSVGQLSSAVGGQLLDWARRLTSGYSVGSPAVTRSAPRRPVSRSDCHGQCGCRTGFWTGAVHYSLLGSPFNSPPGRKWSGLQRQDGPEEPDVTDPELARVPAWHEPGGSGVALPAECSFVFTSKCWHCLWTVTEAQYHGDGCSARSCVL